MKNRYLLILSLLVTGVTTAQITLDNGDFFRKGYYKDYFEIQNDSIDIGMAGANQTFDFSAALSFIEDTFNVEFLDPAATPYASQHPSANVAILRESEQDSITQQTILELWEFVNTTSTESKATGITVRIDTAALFSGSTPTTLQTYHTQNSLQLKYVSTANTYLSNNTFSGGWNIKIGNFSHTEAIVRMIEVDAYGTLINPYTQFDALRFKVREIRSSIDSLNGQIDGSYSDTTYSFEFWIKDLGYYAAKVYTDENYSNIWGCELAKQIGPVGINETKEDIDFLIFPIPAKDLISITTNGQKELQYRIVDMNGRQKIQGRFKTNHGTNSINISELNPGMYLIELIDETGSIGTKTILVE